MRQRFISQYGPGFLGHLVAGALHSRVHRSPRDGPTPPVDRKRNSGEPTADLLGGVVGTLFGAPMMQNLDLVPKPEVERTWLQAV